MGAEWLEMTARVLGIAAVWLLVSIAVAGGWVGLVRRSEHRSGHGGPLVLRGMLLPALLAGPLRAQDATMTRADHARSSRPARPDRSAHTPHRRPRAGIFVDPYSPLLLEDVTYTRNELLRARAIRPAEH